MRDWTKVLPFELVGLQVARERRERVAWAVARGELQKDIAARLHVSRSRIHQLCADGRRARGSPYPVEIYLADISDVRRLAAALARTDYNRRVRMWHDLLGRLKTGGPPVPSSAFESSALSMGS
jgi:hypothetical protein